MKSVADDDAGSTPCPVLIRRERDDDVPTVRSVVAAAFERHADAVPVEVGLLDALRRDEGWLPPFCLVAIDPVTDELVGQVTVTRGHVDTLPALGLGPIAVRPDAQGAGVGSALMHAVVGAAVARDETIIALLGEPRFYARFGFGPSTAVGVDPPDPGWGRYFQVLALGGTEARGVFRYAAPFADLP